ncbi:hypothetical protein NL676_036583 [Syzygium grande]|nr:hypothetical protein NL676_036583 [Syzygium grande]
MGWMNSNGRGRDGCGARPRPGAVRPRPGHARAGWAVTSGCKWLDKVAGGWVVADGVAAAVGQGGVEES